MFIAAWAVLGARRPDYSPVHDPISRLAAFGAPTRAAMTAGFLTFAGGVSLYAAALRSALPGGAPLTAAATAVATLGVAATPLDSALGGMPHAAAAATAYATLAATPLLAVRPLSAAGHRRAARLSLVCGGACGAALAASVAAPRAVGLLQRTGLTLGDAWIIATAVWLARNRGPMPREAPRD